MTETTRKTILIVEDDGGTQLLLATLTRRSGLEPVVASNGKDAMALLKERTFDLIILDLMMPGASGFDVLAFLESETRSERVIVCTAAGPNSIAGIDSTAVSAVIRKPFDIDEFAATVAEALKECE
ncbi:MAG TPA: response regulator [Thermoanaerobaculia bacterium]|nr:response regulator [Thermoanaerobaculia bacterium]